MKAGKIVYSTHDEAKAAAYEMAKAFAFEKWNISEDRIEEYQE